MMKNRKIESLDVAIKLFPATIPIGPILVLNELGWWAAVVTILLTLLLSCNISIDIKVYSSRGKYVGYVVFIVGLTIIMHLLGEMYSQQMLMFRVITVLVFFVMLLRYGDKIDDGKRNRR
jgi:phosphatidylserine synthase